MANYGPKDIKKLREMTDAGMMDCKQALAESDGDMEKAKEWLRDKGLSAAAKKANKVAAEGSISVKVEGNKAFVVEVNSQTDFVAQNEKFLKVLSDITDHAFDNDLLDADAINTSEINGQAFGEYLSLQIATIGEKLVVRRATMIHADEDVAINGYIHANKQIGVIVAAKCDSAQTAEKLAPSLKSVAMHASAMRPSTLSYKDFAPEYVEAETQGRIVAIENENEELKRLGKTLKNVPKFISMSQITHEVLEAEKEEMKKELALEGKPEKIWDKILPGKVERFVLDNTTLDQEQCLLDQQFVMDDSKNVAQFIAEEAKKAGGSAELIRFVRLEVGEGIEIVEEDFASEVARQMA